MDPIRSRCVGSMHQKSGERARGSGIQLGKSRQSERISEEHGRFPEDERSVRGILWITQTR